VHNLRKESLKSNENQTKIKKKKSASTLSMGDAGENHDGPPHGGGGDEHAEGVAQGAHGDGTRSTAPRAHRRTLVVFRDGGFGGLRSWQPLRVLKGARPTGVFLWG